MTIVKTTIKSAGGQTYVSTNIPGKGKTDNDYNLGEVTNQLVSSNFPSFHGTEEEWVEIVENAQEVKIENLGSE